MRTWSRPATLALVIGALVAGHRSPLGAQSPDDAALLAQLDAAVGPGTPPALARASDPVAAQLQDGLEELGRFLRDGDRPALERALFRFNQSSVRRPTWPWPDYAMAHAFLLMHDLGAPILKSEGTTLGERHLVAMWRHLLEALRRDPGFLRARALLGELTYAWGDRPLPDDVRDALAVEVSRRDALPDALLTWSRDQRHQQRYQIALAILDQAAAVGADPSVIALERARTLEALGRPDEARASYWQGLDGLTTRGRALYRQDLGWILDDDSLATFDAVPDGEVAGWLRRFWGERDAAAVVDPGHREVEHLRRWVYAFAHFRIRDPLAQPMQGRATFAFYDVRDPCLGRTAGFSQGLPIIPPPLPGDTRPFETLLDRRGVLYLRHGEPLVRAIPAEVLTADDQKALDELASRNGQPGERLAESLRTTEIWVYRVAGLWRVFRFTVADAADHADSAIAPDQRPMPSARAWEVLARVMPAYRTAANRIAATRDPRPPMCATGIQTAALQHQQDEAVGIDTDTERPPLLEPLDVVNRFFTVGAGRGGHASALVTFAIPVTSLVPRQLVDGRFAWPLRFHLVAYRTSDGTRIDTDTTRIFAAREMPTAGFITGWSELLLEPGTWQLSALVREDGDTTAGGHAVGRGLVVGNDTTLLLGDVLTGRVDQPAWPAPDGPFPVNAVGFWPTDGQVELWYQVGGLHAGDEYRTTLEVTPVDETADGTVRVATTDRAAGAVTTVRKSLGLANLGPGRYHLRVTVEAGERSETREQEILVVTADQQP